MVLEQTRVSYSDLGSLSSCLVEGDPEQQRRASRVKRRAVLASVVVQILVVVALVVFPLFSKGEHITFERTPLPPHPRLGSRDPHTVHSRPNPPRPSGGHFIVNLTRPIAIHDNASTNNQPQNNEPILDTPGRPDGSRDGIDFSGPNRGPMPPVSDDTRKPKEHQRVSIGHIEPALLTHRVDPIYPPLGVTLRHETRVELRAIISTDGSIQSLEVLSGDPLFYRSALDAVRQWRYRPTFLNGTPVEVDTHITVIYTLNH